MTDNIKYLGVMFNQHEIGHSNTNFNNKKQENIVILHKCLKSTR